MPVVPVYGGPQVQATAAPNQRFTVGAQAADIRNTAGASIEKLNEGLGAVGDAMARAEAQADQVRVNEAMNKAVEAKLRRTYDPQMGYVGLKGKGALEKPDGTPFDLETEAVGGLQQDLDGIAKSLGNERQRSLFQQQAGQLTNQYRRGVLGHVAREFGEYQVGVQQGTRDAGYQQMALAWGDADAVAQARGAISASVAEEGRLRGWSGQQVEAARIEALSKGNLAVIASAVDAGKLDYAREYMKQVDSELTPNTRLHLQKILDVGDFEAKTQSKADELYGKFGGDIAGALKEVRATMSGKEEDAVVTRLKTLDSERVALRERAQKDAADEAWRTYASTGSLSKIKPSILTAMDGKDLEALRRTAKAEAEAREAKTQLKTDPSVYYALTIASTQDPQFKNEDLRRYMDKLSPSDFKHFVDIQSRVAKPEKAAEVVSITEQKSALVKTLGLKDEQAGMFHQAADSALFAAQTAKGSALNQDERQKVLDRLVLQGSTPGNWFGTNSKRAFEAQAEGKPFTPEWSDADKRKAAEALQKRGVAKPTSAQIDATLKAAYGIQ